MLTYKFRIYPTAAQARTIEETLETCRRLYNAMLADRIEKRTGFYDQKKMLVELKRDNNHLKSVHSQVLQDVVLRPNKAYQAFFAGLNRYPKFRRSGRYNSFTYPQSGFRLEGDRIRLSTIGKVRVTLHRKVAGAIRRATVIRDIDHKLSDQLTKKNKVIVFEDLKVRNMVKNHNLASAITDAAWGKLRRLTAYKAKRRGGRVILVNPSGTSQKCSGCGEMVPKELSDRVHDCPRCGLVMDRDVNAARNILERGLEQASVEAEPLLVRAGG